MLLRGQNLLGYKHYPDDVVEEFVKKSIKNGIDIIRIFDALNDIRNMQKAIEATREAGGHAQGGISYTISPVHNLDYFVDIASKLKMMGGVDSICIKDMAGLITPWMRTILYPSSNRRLLYPFSSIAIIPAGWPRCPILRPSRRVWTSLIRLPPPCLWGGPASLLQTVWWLPCKEHPMIRV